MDKIFSLDISSTPVVAIVAEKVADQVKIVDRLTINLPADWLTNDWTKTAGLEIPALTSNELQLTEEIQGSPEVLLQDCLDRIQEFYLRHIDDISASILVIPADNYIGLNFNLPFKQESLVKKVINLEIQDLIPFTLDRFYLNYQILDQNSAGTYDVFTSLIPKEFLAKILSYLQSINLDPDYITIPSAILQGGSESSSAVMLVKAGDKQLYLTTLLDHQVKNVQVLELTDSDVFPETEVKMLLWNFHTIYNRKIESIALVGNHFRPDQLASALDLPVEKVAVPGSEAEIIAIQAATALALKPNSIISNFREQNLSANKSLKLAVSYFFKLKVFLILVVVLLILVPVTNYLRTEQEISQIQSSIRANISQRIPWVQFPEGQELEKLMGTSGQIEAQLESLGSPAKADPVEVYLLLSELLAEATGSKIQMDLQQLMIKGDQVEIEGTVPNYKGVDRLEKLIKDKKDIFCRIKVETPGGGVDKRFQFKIRIC